MANSFAQKPDLSDTLELKLPPLKRSVGSLREWSSLAIQWKKLWLEKKYTAAKAKLAELHELQRNLGTENFVTLSVMLLHEAEKARKLGEQQAAVFLYREAIEFAPSLAEPRLRLASLLVWMEPAGLPDAFLLSLSGLRLTLANVFDRSVVLVQMFVVSLFVLGLAFAVFWVLLLLMSFRLFAHDFRALFPLGVSSTQICLLALMLLLLPLVMGGGWVEAFLLWSLVSWFYLNQSQRILVGAGLLLLSGMLWGMFWVGNVATLHERPIHALYLLNRTELQTLALPKVEAHLKKHPRDVLYLWSLGLYHKRRGEFGKARLYYKRALKVSRNPFVLVNLANLDFLEQNGVKAYRRYQKALRWNPYLPEAHYNLSLLFKHSQNTSLVQHQVDAQEAAVIGGGERIQQFIRHRQLQINRYILDAPLPSRSYWNNLWNAPKEAGLLEYWWPSISRWIPSGVAPWVGVVLLVLFLLLGVVCRSWFRARECERCGEVHGLESERNQNEVLCSVCDQLFLRKEPLSARMRLEKEDAIRQFHRRRWWLLFVVQLLSFGGGAILAGRTLRGFCMLLLASSCLGVWLFQEPWLPHPFYLHSWRVVWLLLPFGGLLLWMHIQELRSLWYDRW